MFYCTNQVYAAVKALIKYKSKYLIIEQEFNGNKWLGLPGGKIKYGESPYETLRREIKEEVLLDIKIIKPIGLWWFPREIDKSQVICTTFLCETKNPKIDLSKTPPKENITNYYWIKKKDLPKLKNLADKSLKKLFESL